MFPCVVVVKMTKVLATSHFFVVHGKEKVFATDLIANCICTKMENKTQPRTYFYLDYKWLIPKLIGVHFSVQEDMSVLKKVFLSLPSLALRTDLNAKNWKLISAKMLTCLLLYFYKLAMLQLWKTGSEICATVMWYLQEIWQTFFSFPMLSLSFDSYSSLCFIIRFCCPSQFFLMNTYQYYLL